MSDTTGLWLAVDSLTKPTTMRIHRDDDETTDLAATLLHDLANNPTRTRCSVAEYRRASTLAAGQTAGHGTIPSLWEQAVSAVGGQGDSDGGGSSPARERSVADLALMETVFTVRETVLAEITDHHRSPRETSAGQIRQAASLVAADGDPDTIAWWSWRFEQWSRILGNQLNAVDNGPKPLRLRDTPCPSCGVRQIRVKEQDEWRMVPPLRIDFRHGLVRAATCGGCGTSWMRGKALEDLGDTLGRGVLAQGA